MLKTLLKWAGGALLFAFLTLAPYALSSKVSVGQEAPAVCGYYYDVTVPQLMALDIVKDGSLILIEVAPEKLTDFMAALNKGLGTNIREVTRAFFFYHKDMPELLTIGLEIGGCLADPIQVTFPLPVKHSGKMLNGMVFA